MGSPPYVMAQRMLGRKKTPLHEGSGVFFPS
jgi:hypothetical protein